MSRSFTEADYEKSVLELFKDILGYNYIYGPDVERDYHSPLYENVLLPAAGQSEASLRSAQRSGV